MVIVCQFLVLSVLVLLIISKVVVALFEVLAKSMAASFVILKGELWLYDQSSPLMKPVESSDLLFALSIKLVL